MRDIYQRQASDYTSAIANRFSKRLPVRINIALDMAV